MYVRLLATYTLSHTLTYILTHMGVGDPLLDLYTLKTDGLKTTQFGLFWQPSAGLF